MPIRLALISLSCLSIVGCTNTTELQSSANLVELQASSNQRIQTKLATIEREKESKSYNVLSNFEIQNSNDLKHEWKFENQELYAQKISTAPISPSSYMKLVPTGKKNALGNPLYQLKMYAKGQPVGTYNTVSGRASSQKRNRNLSGTEAPLPNGKYEVARNYIRGTIPEAGDRFLPIKPKFKTGRTDLGIHYDPSFDKDNGEDGTSGCIALTKRQDLDQVLRYIRTYQPSFLEVTI
ncbi:L,D-transpeptidase [Chlorogloeopsis sp. ULAP01]|uniref:L,D-transpeptidase n=1 Tax=Chlorogloeopsis sp. ULAP01 TaxID=3056483 RepID=UPI0025AAD688|nr:L,D-transpeptidase [Chlorogloeopsis sp. ULAP01]MDM9381214.1 L,D-transpeptidase [Chlorogloeopsis sp. ULAP01]